MFATNILAFAISALTAAGSVSAHGYVPQIKIGNEYIPGWSIAGQSSNSTGESNFALFILQDGYVTPQPLRVIRPTKPDSGYIADVRFPSAVLLYSILHALI